MNEVFHILFSKPLKFEVYLTLSTPQLGLITFYVLKSLVPSGYCIGQCRSRPI